MTTKTRTFWVSDKLLEWMSGPNAPAYYGGKE